ncbi:MAG: aromatic amino acid transport family protein [Patescibacteria group bacterium]|jgi:amino acid permease
MPSVSVVKARASRVIIGTTVGVGMLSLPFVVAQVGFSLGAALLFVVALLSTILLTLYADLVLVRGGKARFIQVVGRELGHFGTFIAATAYIASIYGALLAYCIFGGQFLRIVTFSFLPLTPLTATLAFFVIAALSTVGGTFFVSRIQRILLPIFFCLIVVLAISAIPSIHWPNFFGFAPEHLGVAFGVMVFAFHGISAIPEARDLLGRSAFLLPQVIRRSLAVVLGIYGIFVFSIVGVTGDATSENAILGLNNVLGSGVYILASVIALIVVFSAFMNIASSLTNTFLFDFRLRFIPAWSLTMTVPLVFLFLGVNSLLSILSVTGGILGSITAIALLVAYERARMSSELPRNSLRIPQIFVGITFCAFFAIMIMTIFG